MNNIDTNPPVDQVEDDVLFSDEPSAAPTKRRRAKRPPTAHTAMRDRVNPPAPITDFDEVDDYADLLTDKRSLTPYQEAKAAIKKRDAEMPRAHLVVHRAMRGMVYVSQMDRFILEADPTVMFKTEQFNKRFAYAKPDTTKLKTLSEFMFSKMNGTIRKPIKAVFLPGDPPGMLPSGDYNHVSAVGCRAGRRRHGDVGSAPGISLAGTGRPRPRVELVCMAAAEPVIEAEACFVARRPQARYRQNVSSLT